MPDEAPAGERRSVDLLAAIGRMEATRAHERTLASIHAIRQLAESHEQVAEDLALQAAAYAAPTAPDQQAVEAGRHLQRALSIFDDDQDVVAADVEIDSMVDALVDVARTITSGSLTVAGQDADVRTLLTELPGNLPEPLRRVALPVVQSFADHLGDLSAEQAVNAAAMVRASRLATPSTAALHGAVVMLVGLVEETIGRLKVSVEFDRIRHDPVAGAGALEALLDRLERKYFFESLEERLRLLVAGWDELGVDRPHPKVLIEELVERRNAIVHRGGRPSSKYRRLIGDDDPQAMWNSPTDLAYVHDAANAVLVFATWLQVLVCRDLIDMPDAATAALIGCSFDLLEREAWPSVVRMMDLCDIASLDGTRDADLLRVNLLTARAQLLGEVEAVKEVLAWQPANPTTVLQLARACLIGDEESAAQLAVGAVEDGALSIGALRRWPTFAALRESGRWPTVMRALGQPAATTSTGRSERTPATGGPDEVPPT